MIARPHARTDRGARRHRRATLTALTVLASGLGSGALAPSTAHGADEKIACVRAGEKAQKLRDGGKLIAARAELLTCVREVCPAVVRADCAGWLSEVEASTPTIVARARDDSGHDLRDVIVSVDGARVASQLDGRPLPVDPGEHAVRFELAGRGPLEEHVIIGTGEKNRMLAVTFARPASTASARDTSAPASDAVGAAAPRPVPQAPGSPAASSGPPAAAWAFAAVSVTAAASFTLFGLTGTRDLDELRSTCAGHCDGAAVDHAWTKLVVADVSLGVAVLAAGAATWLFLSPSSSSSRSARGAASTPASHAAIVPSSHGASLAWIGAF